MSYGQRNARRVVTLQTRLAISLKHEVLEKWQIYSYSSMSGESKDLSEAAISLRKRL